MSRFRNRPIRNPRYAPEFLERKLSPSGLDAGAIPVDVAYTDPTATTSDTTTDPTDPGDPIPTDPTPPPDPSGPAIT